LNFVVEDQDDGTTGATDGVGEGTLEEGTGTFVDEDLSPAVEGGGVQDFTTTRLHHHTTTDSVEGIGDNTRDGGDNLGNSPALPEGSSLGILQQHGLGSVVTSEEGSTVNDDTEDGDTEASVETLKTITLVDGLDAVSKTVELTVSTLANISTKTSTGEIKRVDEHEGSSTSSTTGGQVSSEEFPEVLLGVVADEDFLVGILEGKVQGLGGEVTDDISQVATPERGEALFLGNADESINNTLVLLVSSDLGRSVLDLQQELDTLDGSNNSLGDTTGNTTSKQVSEELQGFVILVRSSSHFRNDNCQRNAMYVDSVGTRL